MDIKLLKKSMTMLPWYTFNGKRTRLNFFSEHLTMSSQNTLPWNLQCLHKILYSENMRAQLAITCSKLTVETLEQGVKYIQS